MDELKPEYTLDYFIKKFEDISDEMWCTGHFVCYSLLGPIRHCAYGLCGVITSINDSREAIDLAKITLKYYLITKVNDGELLHYQQSTPKARVLAYLYDIKLGNI